jgi:hypothetical protein
MEYSEEEIKSIKEKSYERGSIQGLIVGILISLACLAIICLVNN